MGLGNSRIPFEENGVYHIYNRGYNKATIFNNERCYQKFFEYLEFFLSDYKNDIKLLSYCILPNHFHFILYVPNTGTGTQISKFMKRLQGAYSIWHRNKYPIDFKQSFFEGRFKAKQITSEEYFNKCLYYVNYNAVKHKIVDKIEDYPYSSIHQLKMGTGTQKNKKVPVPEVKINFSLENGLQEFSDDFGEFEF